MVIDMLLELKNFNVYYNSNSGKVHAVRDVNLDLLENTSYGVVGESGSGDSDIMMTDTINPLKSKFKGFHKTFKQDDLGLSLSSFLLN